MRLFAIAICATAALSEGCNRDDSEPSIASGTQPPAATLIKKLTYREGGDTTLYLFWYGTDSLVDSFQIYWRGAFQYTKTFLHQPSFIRAEYPATGALGGNIRWDTLNLDAEGRVVRWNQEMSPLQLPFPAYWYYYNSVGELVYTRQPSNVNSDTIRHTYSNGDLVLSYGERGDSTFYTYDLTKPSLPGDPWHRQELTRCGRNWTTSAHLRVSMRESNGALTNYHYTYDSVGRITRMQLLGGTLNREYFYEY
jgi:hypothetical protein